MPKKWPIMGLFSAGAGSKVPCPPGSMVITPLDFKKIKKMFKNIKKIKKIEKIKKIKNIQKIKSIKKIKNIKKIRLIKKSRI